MRERLVVMGFNVQKYLPKQKKKRTCLDFIRYKYLKYKRFCNQQYKQYDKKQAIEQIPSFTPIETKPTITHNEQRQITEIKLDKNITIIIAIIIIAFAYIYVENKKISYQETLRIQKEEKQKKAKIEYAACMDIAYSEYKSNWKNHCKKRGLKDNCSLPSYNADTIEQWRKNSEDECMEKFKNGMF